MLHDILIEFTTDASGDATANPDFWPGSCYLEKVLYDYGDADTGADITISEDRYAVTETFLTLTNAGTSDLIDYPRRAIDDDTGSSQTLADGDGTRFVIMGRPKVTVAQGGNTKTGKIILVVDVPTR